MIRPSHSAGNVPVTRNRHPPYAGIVCTRHGGSLFRKEDRMSPATKTEKSGFEMMLPEIQNRLNKKFNGAPEQKE